MISKIRCNFPKNLNSKLRTIQNLTGDLVEIVKRMGVYFVRRNVMCTIRYFQKIILLTKIDMENELNYLLCYSTQLSKQSKYLLQKKMLINQNGNGITTWEAIRYFSFVAFVNCSLCFNISEMPHVTVEKKSSFVFKISCE